MNAYAYLFVPGRTPLLSLHELHAMLPGADITDAGSCILVSSPKELNPASLISELGGIVKIAVVRGRITHITAEELLPFLSASESGGRVTFGISMYTDAAVPVTELLHEIKDRLTDSGVSGRYVAGHGKEPLSSVVVSKEHVTELIIAGKEGEFTVGTTESVQDFEQWSSRDRGRRFADAKAGMLPVKVARMVVNIALGADSAGKSLLDPFCGMGTIVAEAYLRGAHSWGSDVSPEAVEKARENIRDLIETTNAKDTDEPQFFVEDATHVSGHFESERLDAIVTEPYMGPTSLGDTRKSVTVSPDKIRNTLKGLGKLYIGALRDWKIILKPGATVVITIPTYTIGGREYAVKNVIDRCENFGYTKLAGPIEYSRPQATVKRNFYILKLA